MNRKYKITIELDTETIEEAESKIKMILLGRKIIDIENIKETRSSQQNRAIHLWFTQLAEELREKGFSVRDILKEGMEVEWTPVLVKEIMWRRLQKAMFDKKSTTQLVKSGEIDEIYDTINRAIIERTKGVAVVPPFPSFDNLLIE